MKDPIDGYDHLEPVKQPLDLDKLADLLVGSNYGTHRMLAALVRARARRYDPAGDGLACAIRNALEKELT